jgi:hypothetical protein
MPAYSARPGNAASACLERLRWRSDRRSSTSQGAQLTWIGMLSGSPRSWKRSKVPSNV